MLTTLNSRFIAQWRWYIVSLFQFLQRDEYGMRAAWTMLL